MIDSNRRNTSKERYRRSKAFPYRTRINEQKWKVIDKNGKEHGKFRAKENAKKEAKRLNKELFREDFGVEEI